MENEKKVDDVKGDADMNRPALSAVSPSGTREDAAPIAIALARKPQLTDNDISRSATAQFEGALAAGESPDEAGARMRGYFHGACDARNFYKQVLTDLMEDLTTDPLMRNGSIDERLEKLEHIAKTHGVQL